MTSCGWRNKHKRRMGFDQNRRRPLLASVIQYAGVVAVPGSAAINTSREWRKRDAMSMVGYVAKSLNRPALKGQGYAGVRVPGLTAKISVTINGGENHV